MGNAQAGLVGLNTTFRANVPQLFLDVDRTKAKRLGVPLDGVLFNTLQAYLGSAYVNDFNKFGRTYQVKVQADSVFRIEKDDMKSSLHPEHGGRDGPHRHAGRCGELDSVRRWSSRYNLYPSAVRERVRPLRDSVPEMPSIMMEQHGPGQDARPSMGFEWTGLSYPGETGRQRGRSSSSGWRSSWCSWSWPRSTRAGRRRSRSSSRCRSRSSASSARSWRAASPTTSTRRSESCSSSVWRRRRRS